MSEKQIEKLFERITDRKYISSSITLIEFSEALLGVIPLQRPIQWLRGNRDLAYLLNTMYERTMFNNKDWKSRVEKRSLFVNENEKPITAHDLGQAINDYQKVGNPPEAKHISAILDEVKALKD